ncbi:unnamed protein product [Paramecium sonneborni]|uniref:MSP domain-containing protein n=1 Tax=Paramecium sonneborni TaxID=65129 RepID=A0A8S1N1Y1_9CILI|nr:unnamed protein product [Paramecium sonneborni]
MITLPQGERLECFKIDGQFIGTLTLCNNKPNNYCAFKIRTNNTQDIQVMPHIGSFTGQYFKITVKCQKFQANAKLQILTVDLTDQNFNKTDVKSLATYFDSYSNSYFVQKIKIEIITIDQNQLTKQSNIINQSISLNKNIEESIYHQQEFTYEQNALLKKNEQIKQQQIRNSYTNSEQPQSISRVSASEQRFLTSTTFQQVKQTPSKQSSNSQNNLQLDYPPPKPQSYPHQPQQPKIHNQQEKELEEDPQVQKLKQRIHQLQIEFNNQQEQLSNIEKQKTQLLTQETNQNQGQIYVGVQHIFFSALICFLIGYVATN